MKGIEYTDQSTKQIGREYKAELKQNKAEKVASKSLGRRHKLEAQKFRWQLAALASLLGGLLLFTTGVVTKVDIMSFVGGGLFGVSIFTWIKARSANQELNRL